MSSKSDLIEIRMKLLGAKEVAEGSGIAAKGVKKVGEASKKTTAESSKAAKANSVLTRSYSKLGSAAKYGLGIIGVSGVFALEQAIHNTEELSKTTTGLNRNLHIGVGEASKWAAVAYGRGIASNQLNMAFTKLGKTFVEANRKGGTARTGLNQLGIGMAETEKGAHNFNYALELTAKRFGEAGGGPKRQAAALSLLGKGYSTILPLFSSGSKGLKEQLHWADEYGVTLSGKTNKGLMDMVTAQRESKVAMLGLQVSLTRALMPAIEAGEGQLQDFIRTLNDPKMSGAEKITAIQHQFEGLENKLFSVLAAMLPGIAEHGAQLGGKLALAVGEGFLNSNALGKAVIAGYLFKSLGGGSLLTTMLKNHYKETGITSGKSFTVGLVLGSVLLGYLLAEELDKKTHGAFRQWGINAGQNFVNFLIQIITAGIEKINDAMDKANIFSVLGVDAPNIPTPGEVDFDKGPKHLPKPGRGLTQSGNPFHLGTKNPGFKPRPRQNAGGDGREELGLWGSGKGKFRTHGNHGAAGVRGRGDLHVHVEVDRQEIARAVVRGGQDDAAFA